MKQVWLRDYGLLPDTGTDCTAALLKALQENSRDTEFCLEPGRYDFWAKEALLQDYYLSNSDICNPRHLSVKMYGMENIVFYGNGSSFIFHGQTMPFTIEKCRGIIVKGISIDWEIPLSAEGTVVTSGTDYIDVHIDKSRFSYIIEKKTLYFLGEDWKEPVWEWGNTEFDVHTHKVAWRSGDTFPPTWQEQLANGLVRFHGNFERRPGEGNFLVLRHGKRIHAAVFMKDSADITMEEMTVYHSGGLGFLAQFCENLTFRRIQMRPNQERGRNFLSGHDDGIHLTGNRGKVMVEECYFHGLMDDCLNLHGVAARIEKKADAHTIIGRFVHEQSRGFEEWAGKGHLISFLKSGSMCRGACLEAEEYRLLTPGEFLITFRETVPADVKEGDSLENLTCTAALTCRNNFFGNGRARGILFTTPQPVVIENNVFESAGAAVLIAGDASCWYESGSCEDVLIQKNHFGDCCLTSSYLGGEAVISIHPEVEKPDKACPFHRNIRIVENTFQLFDVPVLYARSTQGLVFAKNRLIRSYVYNPWNAQGSMVCLDVCGDAYIGDNIFIGDISARETERRG